jgi:hypothetical protein
MRCRSTRNEYGPNIEEEEMFKTYNMVLRMRSSELSNPDILKLLKAEDYP